MVFPATPEEVVGAGVDSVSHICYLAYQAMDRRPDSYEHRFPIEAGRFEAGDNPAMAALFAEMKRRGTILDATIRVYEEVEAAARLAGTPPNCTVALAARLTNQAMRAGVTISAGTDGDNPPAYPYPSLFEEIRLLAGPAGMKPAEVIRAATLTGAKAIGQEAQMGSIAPGKLANFLIVARNPLDDIDNLRRIVMVVKRGRAFLRADYAPPPGPARAAP
jgi:imidazolonepropionase-like amidohydrolase